MMGFIFDEANYRLTFGGVLVCKFRKDATRMHALCRDIAGCPSNGSTVQCGLWINHQDQDANRIRVQKTVFEFNKRQVVADGRLLRLNTVDLGRKITINYDRANDG